MKHTLLALAIFFTGSAIAADTPHALGWKSSAHGIKGAPIETHPLFKAAPLPAAASVAEWFFPTNQKDRGACVAFTAWECASAVYAKNNSGARLDLSALDIYQQCLVADGSFPEDNGTYGTTAINVLLKKGTLSEATWPYSKPLNRLAPVNSTTRAERLKFRAMKAYRVENDDNGFASKQCIANIRIPVMVGSYWYGNGFDARKVSCRTKDAKGKTVTVTRYVLPMPKGRPVGGHEIAQVSYDDNMVFPDGNKGGVEFHNHWSSPTWGDAKGCAWAPYAWFHSPKYAEDKVAIELLK